MVSRMAVPQQETNLFKGCVLRKRINIIARVNQLPFLAINKTFLGRKRDDAVKAKVDEWFVG